MTGRERLSLQEHVETLVLLGLSEWQAKAYLALLNGGKGGAQTISKLSGIPRQHIYGIMSSLQKLSLVQKIISRPTKFSAISIKETICILMERKNQEFVELEQKVTWIIKDLDQVAKKSSIQSESDFILLDSMKMFVQKWKKVCEGAQESMDITFSGGNLPKAMFFIREKWKKALERGIKVRLITEKRKDQQVIPQIEEFLKTPNFQIGFILQRIPAMISIFDNKEIFISTRAPEGIKNVRVLWSNHAGLTALLKAYFDLEWKKAQN